MGVIYRKKQIYGNNPLVETIGVGGGYAPIGTIISFMGTTAPQDYLACDGSTYNITDYSQLATFFEAQFGSKNYFGGDGETTFAVPDLRGEFLRGTGTNSHTDQGSGGNIGAHQNATFIPYTYSYINGNQTAGGMSTRGRSNASNEYNTPGNTDSYLLGEAPCKYIYYQTTTISTSQTDRAYKFSVRPTNTSILWCIKAIDGGEIYSTNERTIGTWIDGKPIYQKTFVFESSDLPQVITDNTSVAAQYPIGEIVNEVIDIQVECLMADGQTYTGTNGFIGGNNSDTRFYRVLGYNHSHPSTANCIYIQSWKTAFNTAKAVITIKYTKTTD